MNWTAQAASRVGALFLAAVLLLSAAPASLSAQEIPPGDRERLAAFARIFVDIADVRERGQAELARTHDAEAEELVRHEFDREVEALIAAHGLSAAEYAELTFLVSADSDYQAVFQALVADLNSRPR
jgi:hypothetical protein